MIWRAPHLHMGTMGHCNEPKGIIGWEPSTAGKMQNPLSIMRKLYILDRFLEVEMMQNHASFEIYEQCSTICAKCSVFARSRFAITPTNLHLQTPERSHLDWGQLQQYFFDSRLVVFGIYCLEKALSFRISHIPYDALTSPNQTPRLDSQQDSAACCHRE